MVNWREKMAGGGRKCCRIEEIAHVERPVEEELGIDWKV